ncbi:hypothetical protein J5N97_024900 [Dioscorea zingiberensis]|uniref:DUF632 domain-containing protein n=1 Tax=Dioscorea zingiberensis TaxID=325984 RepID=A0A9D5H9H7_9LILI|nr:hypothetical protein J5N97_024900 [Dioscorea zingiberensis]
MLPPPRLCSSLLLPPPRLRIAWHRSPSSQSSSSYRSYLASSSNSTSWTESKSDVFDDYGGMESGSHSQTLGRLYAWEKKLYEEVKLVANLESNARVS